MRKPLLVGEHGDEAVQLAVEHEAAHDLAAVGLEAAVHVVQAEPRHPARDPVEELRRDAARERIAPPRLPARDEVEALVELREQVRDLGRVVLQVAVDRDHDVAARPAANPAASAAALPKLRRSRTTRTLSSRACSRVSAANDVVGRAVVDVDGLPLSPSGSSAACELLVEQRRRCAPRCGRGRRPRSRRLVCVAPMAALLTIEEALRGDPRARPAAAGGGGAARGGGRPRARRGRARGGRPAAVPKLGDGRVRRARGRHARARCRWSSGSPPGAPATRPLAAGRGDGDRHRRRRPGRCRRRRPDRARCRERRHNRDCRASSSPARTFGRAAATSPRATWSCARERARRLPSSARSPPRASLTCSCAQAAARRRRLDGHASCAGRASRSSRARSSRRTASCSLPRSRSRARWSTPPDSVRRRRGRSPRGARARARAPTCSSPPGGVSVGPHDLVRTIEAELGVEEVFWRVAVKPGKPISFGVRDGTLVFGLPGNPSRRSCASSCSCGRRCCALQGAREPGPAFAPGELAAAVRRNPERDEFLRARSGSTASASCSSR